MEILSDAIDAVLDDLVNQMCCHDISRNATRWCLGTKIACPPDRDSVKVNRRVNQS